MDYYKKLMLSEVIALEKYATSKDDTGDSLEGVWIFDGLQVASDGHIAIYLFNDFYGDEGMYSINPGSSKFFTKLQEQKIIFNEDSINAINEMNRLVYESNASSKKSPVFFSMLKVDRIPPFDNILPTTEKMAENHKSKSFDASVYGRVFKFIDYIDKEIFIIKVNQGSENNGDLGFFWDRWKEELYGMFMVMPTMKSSAIEDLVKTVTDKDNDSNIIHKVRNHIQSFKDNIISAPE